MVAPQFAAFVQNNQLNQFDVNTMTDAELLDLLSGLAPIAAPVVLSFGAVTVFFFITYLLPTKTKEQGNKYVK
jgi:hypothetical protein